MAVTSPTGAESADNGVRQERKSDPNAAIARLQISFAGIEKSLEWAMERLNSNANRQDEMIATAHTALMESRRILEECKGLHLRINGLPTQAKVDVLATSINNLTTRIDNVDKSESPTATVIGVVKGLRWYQIFLVCSGAAAGLVLLLMFLKRVGLV